MNFARPNVLWLLLVIPPLLVLFYWWARRERRRLMKMFIQARLLSGLVSGVSEARMKVRSTCLIAAVALILLALARPQWGFSWVESKQRGLDIVVAIDTSKSMLAEDIAPNRLGRAKLAALDLMQQAVSDRLGLVAFAGSAFLQCPMTIDNSAFRESVEALDVNIIPQGGTALAEAITTALAAFKEGDNYKVLLLFTDGEDQDEGAVAAAEAAAKEGMRIFTIGIGTSEGELLRLKDAKGRMDYVRDDQGNVVKSRLNEALLQAIAGATPGGAYFRLQGAKTMDTLYKDWLAPLPKSEGQEKLIKQYQERYHWPLAMAITLLLFETLLPYRRASRRARKATMNEATASAVSLIVVLGLAGFATPASASSSGAQRKYEAGEFGPAYEAYQNALKKDPDDARLHFNAAAAAYRENKFDEAANHLTNALSSPDLKLQEQAYYNLGNSLYRTGDAISDPQLKQQFWESAVKDYENTLRLNPQDADAEFNRDFVKKRLEELKQQQQQQQSKDGDQQDQQQNQASNDKDQQEQEKQQQEQNQQEKEQEQKTAQQEQQNQDNREQQQAGNKSQAGQQPQDQQNQQADASKQDANEQPDGEPSQPLTARAMSPEEAQQLLDSLKGDEAVLQFQPQTERKAGERRLNDW